MAAKRLGVVTSGLYRSQRIRRILELLGWRMVYGPLAWRLDAVAGWGEKATTLPARRLAARRGAPYLTLEDGFLRSCGLGVGGDPPLSLIVDPAGAYFNHQVRSGLERLLLDDAWETPALLARAEAGLALLRSARLSKYNPPRTPPPPDVPESFDLVIDQTFGDAAIAGAGADAASFEAMLTAALREAEGAPVVVKTHPDVLAGARRGYLTDAPARAEAIAPGAPVRLLFENVDPWLLLARARRVYAVSSLLGYEAALSGRETHLFGWPFYAGWGLTRDRVARPEGAPRRMVDRETLFAATHLLYPVYFDPVEDRLSDFETVAARLIAERRAQDPEGAPPPGGAALG